MSWLQAYGPDLAALLFVLTSFVAYRVLQRRRARRDPDATLQGQQSAMRAEWAAEILRSGNAILGVQTVRNAMMGALFFASNTMFLVMGTLSLAAQQDLAQTWARLDPGANRSPQLAQGKLLLLLLTLLFAFFCFISAIRLFSHLGVTLGTKSASPALATEQVHAAWRYQGLGVRCYYFAVPVLFWLFGAPTFVLAGLCAIALMHVFDRGTARSRSRPSA